MNQKVNPDKQGIFANEVASRGLKNMLLDPNCAYSFNETLKKPFNGYEVREIATNEVVAFIYGLIEQSQNYTSLVQEFNDELASIGINQMMNDPECEFFFAKVKYEAVPAYAIRYKKTGELLVHVWGTIEN